MPRFVKPSETRKGSDTTGALLRLAETIDVYTDPDALLPRVVELTANALRCRGCLLSLWDDKSQRFVPAAAFGLSPELERAFFQTSVTPDDIPFFDEMLQHRVPVIARIDEPILPESVRRFVSEASGAAIDATPIALLGVPLINQNTVLGGMLVIAAEQHLGQHEVTYVTGIARQTALAIASARAFEQERRRRRDLEMLQENIALFSAELELETLYQRIVERAALTFFSEAAALFLWEENRESLPAIATFGISEPYRKETFLSSIVVRPLLDSFVEPCPFVIADLQSSALIDPEVIEAERFRAALMIPLWRSHHLLGLIMVFLRGAPTSLDEDALALAQALAHQAVTALENAQLYTALRTERERLRALSARLTQAQEAERTRVARELHDEAGQALTAVRLQLDYLASALPADLPRHLRQHVEEAQVLVGRTLEEIRRISIDLRPSLLDDLGLAPALRWQCNRLSRQGTLTVRFLSRQETRRLMPRIETAVYRVAQEALTNIVRHADATAVDVILDYRANRLHLTITDDGKGFPRSPDHTSGLGLMGMQERLSAVGGSLHIDSQPSIGTTLFIEVPL